MHEQVNCEIGGVELEDGFVIYDKCCETAWVEMHPQSALKRIRQ